MPAGAGRAAGRAAGRVAGAPQRHHVATAALRPARNKNVSSSTRTPLSVAGRAWKSLLAVSSFGTGIQGLAVIARHRMPIN